MQSETLKPCPFGCVEGNMRIAWVRVSDDCKWWNVECGGCFTHGPHADTEAEAITAWNERPHIAAQDAEIARLREAVKVLRDGYADAVSGYEYITQQHGRLAGVGFDRVTDHFFEHVTVPEREGLLAGSHWLPAIVKTETPHAK